MYEERIPCITTTDNPYDPFTEFDQWESFDLKHGYFTCYALQDKVQKAEKCLQMVSDKYWIDFGKAMIIGMMSMVYQDEKRKLKHDLRQILPENVHYRIVWEDEEPE